MNRIIVIYLVLVLWLVWFALWLRDLPDWVLIIINRLIGIPIAGVFSEAGAPLLGG
jgi:hypothetical protein